MSSWPPTPANEINSVQKVEVNNKDSFWVGGEKYPDLQEMLCFA